MRRSVVLDALFDKIRGVQSRTVRERLLTLKEEGVTQVDLSLMLGVTEATVSRWVSGERIPRGRQTHRLLDFIEDKIGMGDSSFKGE